MKKNSKKILKMVIFEILLIILIIITAILINNNYLKFPTCYIQKRTGLKCPSCGGTTCIIYLLNGNFKKSFLAHPVFFLLIIYGFLINFLYIINTFTTKKIGKFLYPKSYYAIIFGVIIIIYTILRNIYCF
jgi:hypothetical protein